MPAPLEGPDASLSTSELRHEIFATLSKAGIVTDDLRGIASDLQAAIRAELARRDAMGAP